MIKQVLIATVCLSLLLLCSCQPTNGPANDPAPVVLTEPMFFATVVERAGSLVTVCPLEGEEEYTGGNTRICFSVDELDELNVSIGEVVQIAYDGNIMETYPAQIHATAWAKATDLRGRKFKGEWLDKSTATVYGDGEEQSHLVITTIYADCFFARSVVPMPYVYKINGAIGEEWCVGDQVLVHSRNAFYDNENNRGEMDLISIEMSDFEIDPNACYKPVIYLYPEETTEVDVTLTLDGELTCAYPAYREGWHVTAEPDGTLTDASGQTYNYLYWEGETNAVFDMSRGFCVKGEDTAAFLEEALERLGLTRREANEFIVYWLPLMQENPYNLIAFQGDAYTDAAKLDIAPAPDTLIRVFMTWQASDSFVELEPQTLTAPERVGFTVVEWGGTQIP